LRAGELAATVGVSIFPLRQMVPPLVRGWTLDVLSAVRKLAAIGLAPRSSRFQKPEGVASKFARWARLRIATL